MSRLAFIAAAIATGLAFQAPASASTVSFATTLDLSAPSYFSDTGIRSFAYWDGFSGFVPQQVAVGDEVNVKYSFANGVGVTASNIRFGAAYILDFDRNTGDTADGTPYEQIDSTGTLSFLDADGNVILSHTEPTSECCISLGTYPSLATGPITFYGVLLNLTVLASDPNIPRIYNTPMLTILGSDFAIVPATTPIPAALPLFVSALGGLGLFAWRRRKGTVAAAT